MDEAHEKQIEDLYAALGRFAVEFEHVCNNLRIIIMNILDIEGLRNERVTRILLSDLTADPLRSLATSLISETRELSEIEKKIVSKVFNSVQDLTKTRNDVLHGTWFIGWASYGDTGCSNAPGIKLKKDKAGDATKTFDWRVDDFNRLSEDAVRLGSLLARISGCIAGNFSLEKNFVLGKDGSVSCAPGIYK